jgi:uncharacterized RDD family membrane protein YckC
MTIQWRAVAERVYSVETPESMLLYFERAGLASRAVAFGVDLLLMTALSQGVMWILSPLGLLAESAAGALWIIVGFLVQWGYGAVCEWRFAGRTFGKRLHGLSVVDASGLRLSFGQAAVRNLLRVVDLLPGFYLLGATCCLLDRHGRRLGDLAARTVVVRSRRVLPPKELGAVASTPLGPWGRPILEGLRHDEQNAIVALSGALETLSLADRVGLCGALVEHFARRHQLTVPTHLSAERVVLLLRDALGNTETSERAALEKPVAQARGTALQQKR